MKSPYTVCALLAFVGTAEAQAPPAGLIDVFVVKVKPEKRADFDAVAKKIAEANHKYKGDNWIAYSVEYGDQNTVTFFQRPR